MIFTRQVVKGPGLGGSFPAGQEGSYVIPAGPSQRLDGFFSTLDGTGVGNRYPGIQVLDDAGNPMYTSRITNAVGATGQPDLSVSRGQPLASQQSNTTQIGLFLPFPDIWLPPGYQINTSMLGLQALDQYQFIGWHMQSASPDADGDPPYPITKSINGAQPAGAEFTYTVPAGNLMRLAAIQAALTCSATIISRFPGYTIRDAHGNNMHRVRAQTGWTASQSLAWSAAKGAAFANQTGGNAQGAINLPIPTIWLWPGCQIITSTLQLQAGDQYTAINLYLETLPVGSVTYP